MPPGVKYPTSLDDSTSLYDLVNNVTLTLTAPVNDTDTVFLVAPNTTSLSATNSGLALINNEIILYEGTTLNSLTNITRGFAGTTATSHTTSEVIFIAYFAEHHNELRKAIVALETEMGLPSAAAGPNSIFSRLLQAEIAIQGGMGSLLLNKRDALVAPTVNDDSDDGYAVGSRWIDLNSDKEYVLLDATVGAAIWKDTTIDPGAPGNHAASHVSGGGDEIRPATDTQNGLATPAQIIKLDGIEALADVTDTANVAADRKSVV